MGFRWPSNKTLGKITVFGAITTISAALFMKYKIEQRLRNQDYFKDAVKTLSTNPGVIKLLGEPIRESGVDISDDKKSFCDGNKAQFEVSVRGPKDRGTMFFWSERSDNDGWKLKRLELEIKSQPDKRFLVLKEDTNTN